MQTSGITKELRSFLFYFRVQLILFKDNAKFRLNEENAKVFAFLSVRNLSKRVER